MSDGPFGFQTPIELRPPDYEQPEYHITDRGEASEGPAGFNAPGEIRQRWETIYSLAAQSAPNVDGYNPSDRLEEAYTAEYLSRALNKDPGQVYKDLDYYKKIYSKMKDPPKDFWAALKDEFETTAITTQTARVAWDMLFASVDKWPDYEQRVQELQKQMPDPDNVKRTGLQWMLEEAVRQLPFLMSSMSEGWKTGLQAGSAAMVASAAAGVVSGGLAAPLIPPAVLHSFTIGATVGTFKEAMRLEGGLMFLELLQLEDDEGNRIDPNLCRAAALSYGALAGAIEVAQINQLLRGIPGVRRIVDKAVYKLARNAHASGRLKSLVMRFAGEYVGNITGETMEELAQESLNILGRELAVYLNNDLEGTDITPETRQEIIDRIQEVAQASLGGFAVLQAPGSVAGAVSGHRAQMDNRAMQVPPEVAPAEAGGAPVGVQAEKGVQVPETPVTPTEAPAGGVSEQEIDLATEEARTNQSLIALRRTRDQMMEQGEDTEAIDAQIERLESVLADIQYAREGMDVIEQPREAWEMTSREYSRLQFRPDKSEVDYTRIDDPVRQKIARATRLSAQEVDGVAMVMELAAQGAGKALGEYVTEVFHPDIIQQVGTEKLQGHPAAMQLMEDGRAIIYATEQSNFADMVHELGHVFTHHLKEVEVSLVEEWAGAKIAEWDDVTHEQFARAMEQYLYNGEASTPELTGIFQRFADWLRNIYHNVVNRWELHPNLRQAFDSMFAPQAVSKHFAWTMRSRQVPIESISAPASTLSAQELEQITKNIQAGPGAPLRVREYAPGQYELLDESGRLQALEKMGETQAVIQIEESDVQELGTEAPAPSGEGKWYQKYDELGRIERAVLDDYVGQLPDTDRERIQHNIDRFSDTPYGRQLTTALLMRSALERLAAGQAVQFDNVLFQKRQSGSLYGGHLVNAIQKNGMEGLADYFDLRGWLNEARKPEVTVNGSFLACHPSPSCAQYCYAAGGRYVFPDVFINREGMALAIERFPGRAAAGIIRSYRARFSDWQTRPLRFFDVGDMSDAYLQVIAELNGAGIRTQIFSKRPELLNQVNDGQNIRLLSIDNSNIDVARANPALNLAFVYSGIEDMPLIREFKEQIQVVLPIRQARGYTLAENIIVPLYQEPGLGPKICPVDADRRDMSKGVCALCNRGKGIGCCYRKGEATVTPKKDIHELTEYVNLVYNLMQELSDEEGQRLGQEGLPRFLESIPAERAAKYLKLLGLPPEGFIGPEAGATEVREVSHDAPAYGISPTSRLRQQFPGGVEVIDGYAYVKDDPSYDYSQNAALDQEIEAGFDNIVGEEQDLFGPVQGQLFGEEGAIEQPKKKSVVRRAWKKFKRIDMRGLTIHSTRELAEAFSVYRNPKVEAFHIIYLKNNQVIAHNLMSSGLPGTTFATETDNWYRNLHRLDDRMKRLGADTFYLMHNHPSGDPTHSNEDVRVTTNYEASFAAQAGKFGGHIIIDDDMFTLITDRAISQNLYEPKKTYTQPFKSGAIHNDEQLSNVLSDLLQLKEKTNYIVLANGKNRVLDVVETTKLTRQIVYDTVRQHGATNAFGVVQTKEDFEAYLKESREIPEDQMPYNALLDLVLAYKVGEETRFASALSKGIMLSEHTWQDYVNHWRHEVGYPHHYAWEEGPLYQGSAADFEQYSMDYVGTGEGGAAFGWGMYFTSEKDVAKNYAYQQGGAYEPSYLDIQNEVYDLQTQMAEKGVQNTEYLPQILWELLHGELSVDDWIEEKETLLNSYQYQAKSLRTASHFDTPSMRELRETRALQYDQDAHECADKLGLMSVARPIIEAAQRRLHSRNIYTVILHAGKSPDQYDYMQWYEPLSPSQKDKIAKQATKEQVLGGYMGQWMELGLKDNISGKEIYSVLVQALPLPLSTKSNISEQARRKKLKREASLFLLRAGIDGIKYPVGTLHGGPQDYSWGTNYVVFDPGAISIQQHRRFQTGNMAHEEEVKRAVLQGKPVPDPVLMEYQDKEWARSELERRAKSKRRRALLIELSQQAADFTHPGEFTDFMLAMYAPETEETEAGWRELLGDRGEAEQRRFFNELWNHYNNELLPITEANKRWADGLSQGQVESILAGIWWQRERYKGHGISPIVWGVAKGFSKYGLSDKGYKAVVKLMKSNPEMYRAIEAEVNGDTETLQHMEQEKEIEQAFLEYDREQERLERLQPLEERMRLGRDARTEQQKAKLFQGEYSDVELTEYLTELHNEIKQLKTKRTMLQKELREDERKFARQEEVFLSLRQELAVKEKELQKKEREIERVKGKRKQISDTLQEARREAALAVKITREEYEEAIRDLMKSAEEELHLITEQNEEKWKAFYTKALKAEGIATRQEVLQAYEEALESAQKEARLQSIVQERDIRRQMRQKEAEKRHALKMKQYMRDLGAKITRPVPKTVDVEYRQMIEAIQAAIDPHFRSPRTLKKWEKRREFFKQHPEARAYLSKKIEKTLWVKPLNNFTMAELEELWTQIDHLIKIGRTKRRLIEEQRQRDIEYDRDRVLQQIVGVKPPKEEVTGVITEFKPQVGKAFYLSTLRPHRLADMLDGGKQFKGPMHQVFIDAANKAEDAALHNIDRRRQWVKKKMQEIGVTEHHLMEEVEVDGVNFRIEQILDVWAGWKNQRKHQALRWGNHITEEMATRLFDHITEADKRFAEEAVMADFDDNFPRLRDTVILLENRDPGSEPWYTPMRRMDYDKELYPEQVRREMEMRASLRKAMVRYGGTQQRVDIPAEFQHPIRLGLYSIWHETIEQEEHYIEFAELVVKLRQIWGHPAVTREVKSRFGSALYDQIDRYVHRLANPNIYKSFNATNRIIRHLRQASGIGYLAFNVTTMFKQVPSMMLYMPELMTATSPRAVFAAFYDITTNWRKTRDWVETVAPQLKHRAIERILEELKKHNDAAYKKITHRLGRVGMQGIREFDKLVTTWGFLAVYYEKSGMRRLSEGVSDMNAIQEALNVTLRTQPAASAKDIADLYANDNMLTIFLQFTNQLNQIWNMAVYDAPASFRHHAWKQGVVTYMAIAMAGMWIWTLTHRELPDEPEEMIEGIIEQLMNSMPIIGPSATSIMRGFEGGRQPVMVPAYNTFELMSTLRDYLSGENISEKEREYRIKQLAEAISVSYGLPYIGAERVYETLTKEDVEGMPARLQELLFGGQYTRD